MASQNPPESYDEATLLALEQALRDVWQVLEAHDFYRNSDRDDECKTNLARTLMALADAGVRDPQQLRARALETLDLDPPH
jgi:hypothetical protein